MKQIISLYEKEAGLLKKKTKLKSIFLLCELGYEESENIISEINL